jgi:hypothetical protein
MGSEKDSRLVSERQKESGPSSIETEDRFLTKDRENRLMDITRSILPKKEPNTSILTI